MAKSDNNSGDPLPDHILNSAPPPLPEKLEVALENLLERLTRMSVSSIISVVEYSMQRLARDYRTKMDEVVGDSAGNLIDFVRENSEQIGNRVTNGRFYMAQHEDAEVFIDILKSLLCKPKSPPNQFEDFKRDVLSLLAPEALTRASGQSYVVGSVKEAIEPLRAELEKYYLEKLGGVSIKADLQRFRSEQLGFRKACMGIAD